ncbi:MAG: biopolymer transporter ExbD [Opitutales bacterium]
MARRFQRNPRLSALAEPNVTPLIDLAFSLLIIFMITTPLLEQTIPLELPREAEREDDGVQQEAAYQAVGVAGPGIFLWGSETLEEAEMLTRLMELQERDPETILNIQASGAADYQQVIDLINLIKQSGLTKISLDTQVNLD